MKRKDLNAALEVTRTFLASLVAHSNLPLDDAPTENPRSHFRCSRSDEGTIALNEVEFRQYRGCITALVGAVIAGDDGERVSQRAVEGALQEAMFAAIDIHQRRPRDTMGRCEQAIRELRKQLTGPPQRFRVLARVHGLADDGLPTRVGNVEFARFDETQLECFRDAVSRHDVPEHLRQQRLEQVAEWGQSEELADSTIAVVEVQALEWEAAQARALREIRLTLDVINFFSDVVPHNQAHLSLPGDGQTVMVAVLQLRHEQGEWASYHHQSRWVGGMGELSLPAFNDYDARRPMGFGYACQLLGSRRGNLGNRLIASLQWAGRATVDRRREEAFLLYAIALESFVLAEDDHQELNYRLRIRVAHLLGQTPESRSDLFEMMVDLYKVRSKIVHSGQYQVTDADLGQIRRVTKACLMRACTSDVFTRMDTTEQLRNWFRDQVLG